MADGKIEIDTSIDTKGAESGLKNLTSKLKTFGKGSMVVAGVTTAIKTMNKVVKETSQLYRTQATAEKQLEASAKNNPYLNSSSVKQLKDYASYLQSIGTIGDEQILPLMSQLASAGRTQSEIQDILSASLDVSATGMMSLDSAVQSLNSSYSGNIGLLGRQISELKNLTTEELKSGKAVEIIKEKFGGVSEEVTKATGSSEQLKNAWGDLKEEIGYSFEKNMTPMRTFFTELIQGWTDAKKKKREYEEEQEAVVNGTSDNLDLMRDQVNELQSQKNKYQSSVRSNLLGMGYTEEQIKKEFDNDAEYIKLTKDLKTARDNLAKATKRVAEEEAKRKAEEEANKQNDAMKSRDELRSSYDETIRQAQEEIRQRRLLGEEISAQEEAQQMLNVAMDSYVKMMSDPAFQGNSGNYSHEVNARSQIAKWMEDAKELPEITDNFDEFQEKLDELTTTEKDAKQQEIDLLDSEYDALNLQDKEALFQKYVDARQKLSDELIQMEKDEADAQKQSVVEMTETVSSCVSQFSSITSTMTDMLTTQNETTTSTELASLENQYEQGLVSYEDFCDKKEEINKKSAQEQYRINMWTWTASLLEATSNIAQGVSKALTGEYPMNLVNAGLVATAGAMQIASITASKPIKPSFATGGVVGGMNGASMGSDNTVINARNGEMILNALQQRELWQMANGSTGSGSVLNMPITIENNNGSNVSTQMDSDGLRVIIDNIVNAGMKQGRYTESMNVANNKSQGVRYL